MLIRTFAPALALSLLAVLLAQVIGRFRRFPHGHPVLRAFVALRMLILAIVLVVLGLRVASGTVFGETPTQQGERLLTLGLAALVTLVFFGVRWALRRRAPGEETTDPGWSKAIVRGLFPFFFAGGREVGLLTVRAVFVSSVAYVLLISAIGLYLVWPRTAVEDEISLAWLVAVAAVGGVCDFLVWRVQRRPLDYGSNVASQPDGTAPFSRARDHFPVGNDPERT